MSKEPEIVNENILPDGGYTATVTHYGRTFQVGYVNSEVRVYGAVSSGFQRGWKSASSAAAVKKFIAERIASFGPEFQQAHKKLYQE